jgi:DNA replication and repair protein RecF
MWIKKLTVNNCRLLKNISLEFSPDLNLIIGPNASGKTSLVESLSVLSTGRTFRTSHISELINHDQDSILVAAVIDDDGSTVNMGIEKTQNKTKIRINQQDVFSQATLSSCLPITIINPNSIDLIIGSPSLRRSYIDWIAFYLFPDFLSKWKKYRHILKQRNFCLKHPKHFFALDKWTEELIALQPEVTEYRTKVIELLTPILKSTSSVLIENCEINLEFHTGFPKEININPESLTNYYESKKEYDIKLKRTSSGIHKADMKVLMNGIPAAEAASRGQLKLLAICLLLAQSESINDDNQSKGILVIDDLAAELDQDNNAILLKYLSGLNKQLIITSTKNLESSDIKFKMFHVKHGEIKHF